MQPLPQLAKGVYRHYKGGLYEVLEVARHSETREPLVVYRPLYGERECWVRPWSMFVEQVVVEGVRQPRFVPVPAAADRTRSPTVQETTPQAPAERLSEAELDEKARAILSSARHERPDFSTIPLFENPRHARLAWAALGIVLVVLGIAVFA